MSHNGPTVTVLTTRSSLRNLTTIKYIEVLRRPLPHKRRRKWGILKIGRRWRDVGGGARLACRGAAWTWRLPSDAAPVVRADIGGSAGRSAGARLVVGDNGVGVDGGTSGFWRVRLVGLADAPG